MKELRVNHVNHAYVRVESDDKSLLYDLQDFFSFDAKNAKFSPAFRKGRWNGKTNLYSPFSGLLPVGLINYLPAFCVAHQCHVEPITGVVWPGAGLDRGQAREFVLSLSPTAHGKAIEPFDHQIDAFMEAVNGTRTTLLSPTASGKSLVIYSLIRYYQNVIPKNRKMLIIVPSISLVTQMVSDFDDYSRTVDWNANKECHKICEGAERSTDKQIVVSTWQSIYKLPRIWFDSFDVVIGDECHLFRAKSLKTIMMKLVNAPYRTALTGTLDGTELHRLEVEGLFGPAKQIVKAHELMEKEIIASLSIECVLLKYPKDVCHALHGSRYADEVDWVVRFERRNAFITQLATSLKGNTLVLFQFVNKQGKPLFEMVKKALEGTGRKVFYVSGETEGDEREDVRKIVEKETNAIIVASYGVFSTGVSVRNLNNLVFASPSKGRIRVIQSIGRQLRKSETKNSAKLYDIADDLHWKKDPNYGLKHLVSRMMIYDEEKYPYKVVKVSLYE